MRWCCCLKTAHFANGFEHESVPVLVVPLAGLKQVRRESGWKSVLASVPGLLQTRSHLRRVARDYDLLYANSMKALLVACLVRRWNQPVVWHLRDILSADHFSKLLRLMVVAVANSLASAIIVNSHATAEAFVASGGSRSKMTVVYDGVDAAAFDALDAASTRSLRASFTAPGRLLIGVFSRLSHWKGQHIVLEAISEIPHVDLLIVGDALFGEAAYAESLRARAARPDLAGRVRFLGFRSDTAELMRCVDIVVHSSTSAEPFGLVIVEGMLACKPVIATRAGGAMEIIQQDKSGLLVTPGSIEELLDAILYLGSNTDEMFRLGRAGKRRARDKFPVGAMFQGIEEVIQRQSPARGKPVYQVQSRTEATFALTRSGLVGVLSDEY